MTRMKSVSGIVCYVRNVKKTAIFYKALGFEFEKDDPDYVSVYLNWFWIDFHPQDKIDKPEFQEEKNLKNKGSGLFLYISVEKIDDFYDSLLKKGLKLSSQPKDYPWGNREFIVHDPDGYKLVFFSKIKKHKR